MMPLPPRVVTERSAASLAVHARTRPASIATSALTPGPRPRANPQCEGGLKRPNDFKCGAAKGVTLILTRAKAPYLPTYIPSPRSEAKKDEKGENRGCITYLDYLPAATCCRAPLLGQTTQKHQPTSTYLGPASVNRPSIRLGARAQAGLKLKEFRRCAWRGGGSVEPSIPPRLKIPVCGRGPAPSFSHLPVSVEARRAGPKRQGKDMRPGCWDGRRLKKKIKLTGCPAPHFQTGARAKRIE